MSTYLCKILFVIKMGKVLLIYMHRRVDFVQIHTSKISVQKAR